VASENGEVTGMRSLALAARMRSETESDSHSLPKESGSHFTPD